MIRFAGQKYTEIPRKASYRSRRGIRQRPSDKGCKGCKAERQATEERRVRECSDPGRKRDSDGSESREGSCNSGSRGDRVRATADPGGGNSRSRTRARQQRLPVATGENGRKQVDTGRNGTETGRLRETQRKAVREAETGSRRDSWKRGVAEREDKLGEKIFLRGGVSEENKAPGDRNNRVINRIDRRGRCRRTISDEKTGL